MGHKVEGGNIIQIMKMCLKTCRREQINWSRSMTRTKQTTQGLQRRRGLKKKKLARKRNVDVK